jgi:hypothetical protein
VLFAGASIARAQEPGDTIPQQQLVGPQHVTGHVVRPVKHDMLPVGGVWVTLHRVGSDRAAPLDSTRAGGDGGYSFTYARSGDPAAIYFVSAKYAGIAYFTPPLKTASVRGDDAEIVVFDTTSIHPAIGVRGHHIVVSSADTNGMRSVTEVFELANDTSVTFVSSGSAPEQATWTTRLPAKAREFRVSQGDFPSAAVTFVNGRARVYAPIAPGLRQFAMSYELPGSVFPIRYPIESQTSVLEVLIEDPEGSVEGGKLREVDPVAAEHRSFRRFSATDVPATSIVAVDFVRNGSTSHQKFLALLTVVIGVAMLSALAIAYRRR